MCPSPQHAGGLPASGVTGLQAAPSFLGDFLEFVSNAAIEYRPLASMGTGAARCSSPKRLDPIGLAYGAIAACFQRRFDLGRR